MTKLKLLSSISVFLVALSAVGCSVENDSTLEDTIPGTSESGDSTLSSDSEDSNNNNSGDDSSLDDEPHSGYYNFSLSFTFTDTNGDNTLLPDNATAYILGGWDNWSTYRPLTYTDESYIITFDKMETGTYRYKLVMWFSDETVSWFNCVEITDENQILRVRTDYYDNYVLNISLEFNASLPTDEERENKLNTYYSTTKILNAAYSVGCLTNLWDAIHVEAESSEGKTVHNICLNPDSHSLEYDWGDDEIYRIYGVTSYDDYVSDCSDYYYYIDGLRYDYYLPYSGAILTHASVNFINHYGYYTLEDMVEDYSKSFSEADQLIDIINNGVDSNGNGVYYSVTTEGNEYTLVVNSEAKGTYTYRCTSDLEFTYIAYENDEGYKYEAYETTIPEIEEKVDLLRSSFTFCIEPVDVFRNVYTNCNYTVQYEFEQMITNNYVTYGEYEAASSSEKAQIEYELELDFELIDDPIYICYTDDAVFIKHGYIGDDGIQTAPAYEGPQYLLPIFISDYGILLVNGTTVEGNDCLYVYFSDDCGDTWQLGSFTDANGITHASDQPVYEGHWQDYCYNIGECYDMVKDDELYYEGAISRYDIVGSYTMWTHQDEEVASYVFKCLGGEFLFGDYYNEYLSTLMGQYLLFFDPYYQTTQIDYYYQGFFPDEEDFLEDGWEISDDTHLYIRYLEVIATIENLGSVDIANTLSNWNY